MENYVPRRRKMRDAKQLGMRGIMLDMRRGRFRDNCGEEGSMGCMLVVTA